MRKEKTAPRYWEPRQVVRDRNGCFLGVFSLSEARRYWPKAYSKDGVIAVPGTVEFADALFTIGQAKDLDMAKAVPQYKRAAKEAADYPRGRTRVAADKHWDAIRDTPVEVRYRTSAVIAHLSPAELTESFGTAWFMVSAGRAQLITNGYVTQLESAAQAVERKSRPPRAGAADPRQPKAPGAHATRTKPIPTKDDGTLVVVSADGKVAYRCGGASAQTVVSYLKATLPSGSFTATGLRVQLTRSLDSLGFKNPQEFAAMCAAVARGKKAKRRWTRAEKEAGHRLPKGDDVPVSFDGPEHALHVFKGTYGCRSRGHVIESVTGVLATLRGSAVRINVNHCKSCGTYSLGYGEYEHYRDLYGPILGNFTFHANWANGGYGFDGLADESVLMMCGYTVRQSDCLSASDRQCILASMMDRGICDKPRIMDYLQFFIRSRGGNPSMQLACAKWEEDLDFVRNYRIDRQRRFIISSVRQHR